MTPTPTQIATQVAAWAERHDIQGGASIDNRMAYEDAATGPYAQSLILSAAAKMVRQSGAVEAMTEASEWLAELFDDGDSADWCLKKHAEISTCLKKRAESLRSITGEAGDRQG